MVNLYQLYFSSFHFLSQLNKKNFHHSTFSPLQSNTNEGKLNLFYHFTIFYPLTFPSFQPNEPLGYVWMEEWKSGRVENCERMEKWEDRKNLIFPHLCLVERVEK